MKFTHLECFRTLTTIYRQVVVRLLIRMPRPWGWHIIEHNCLLKTTTTINDKQLAPNLEVSWSFSNRQLVSGFFLWFHTTRVGEGINNHGDIFHKEWSHKLPKTTKNIQNSYLDNIERFSVNWQQISSFDFSEATSNRSSPDGPPYSNPKDSPSACAEHSSILGTFRPDDGDGVGFLWWLWTNKSSTVADASSVA